MLNVSQVAAQEPPRFAITIEAPESATNRKAELPRADVRRHFDDAFRRGWMEASRRFLRAALLTAVDMIGSALSIGAAVLIAAPLFEQATPGVAWLWPLVMSALCVQPLAFEAVGAFESGPGRVNARRIARGVIVGSVVGWLYTIVHSDPIPGVVFLLYTPVATAAVYAGRVCVDRIIRAVYRRGVWQRKLLFIGTRDDLVTFSNEFLSRRDSGFRIVGRFPSDWISTSGDRHALLSALDLKLRESRANCVVIDSSLDPTTFEALVHACFDLGVGVAVVPRTIRRIGHARLDLQQAGVGSLMRLTPDGLRLPQLAIKRAIDLTLTAFALILVAPVMLLIAIAIKMDSSGPVLFSQIRAGVGGRPFRMYKFRTMVDRADSMKCELHHLNESGDPRLFKIRNDPRVTRVGRVLRKTSLDELPQLFNVLRGDMSLVGPRPFFPGDLDEYEDHHFVRLHVLPGITGLWQVSGRSDVVDFEEVVRLDAEYIRDWSIWRDFAILWRTIPAAFGRGAY